MLEGCVWFAKVGACLGLVASGKHLIHPGVHEKTLLLWLERGRLMRREEQTDTAGETHHQGPTDSLAEARLPHWESVWRPVY